MSEDEVVSTSLDRRDMSLDRRDMSLDQRDMSLDRRDTSLDQRGEPLLRVVRGEPTAEELAALVAVVASLCAPGDAPARRRPVWNAPSRLVRVTHRHGVGGWRASGLPT